MPLPRIGRSSGTWFRAHHMVSGLYVMALVAVSAAFPGCANKESISNDPTPPAAAKPAPAATQSGAGSGKSGTTLLMSNGCMNCHSLNGKGGGTGPDLTHVGGEAEHTPQWLEDQIKNPKSHTPGSRMPGFAGKINEKDITTLGTYLATLK